MERLTLNEENISSSLSTLLVLTGPTSAGKTEISSRVLQTNPDFKKIVTSTTRQPRAREIDGTDYHFLTREQFLLNLQAGDYLESTEYGGNLYGTTKTEINTIFEGKSLITTMDMFGAVNIENNIRNTFNPDTAQKLLDNTLIIFVGVPALTTLKDRFINRGDDRNKLLRRLQTDWQMWIDNKDYFTHVIVNKNGEIDTALLEVDQLLQTYRD